MAALDQTALNLANSLEVSDIPIKLRCTTCNKLAINAFKLPCCDQSICDTCQSSLPETCPVCAHSPLDGTSCKQNKSLRLTIKAFLKSEEKKRSKEVTESQPPPSATPAQENVPHVVAGAPVETPLPEVDGGAENASAENVERDAPAGDEVVESVEQVSDDQALAPVDVPPEEALIPQENVVAEVQPADQDAEQGADQVDEDPPQGDDNGDQNMENNAHSESGPDGQQQGMQNMMGFNPMMQMGGFGGFNPMMGMTGMGMNPMNMPFNGFGGMGMNNMSGMNMGMNFGGNFGGWNNQGMGGNFGSGYYPQGGYNQHQMHQMHNQQFPNRNFQNRFRGRGGYGRGRGGFAGRGGHFNQFQNQQNGYNQMGNGMSGGPQAEDASYHDQANVQGNYESQAQSGDGQPGDQADLSAQFQPGDAADHDDANGTATNGDMTQAESTNDMEQANGGEDGWEHTVSDLPNSTETADVQMTIENDQTTDQNASAMHDDQNGYVQDQSNFDGQWNNDQDMSQDGWGANNDFNMSNGGFQDFNQQGYGFGGRGRGRGGFRGGFRGRGGYQGFRSDMQVPTGPPVEPPINAPTGPKAMREGLPNSGKYSRPQITQPSATPAPQSVHQGDQATSFAAAPSERGRSPSRAASDRERKRKHHDRSHSTSTQDHEAKDRRRSHRRRHEDKYSDSHGDDDRSSRRNRSRSRSAGSSDRRQRRRDKERYKSTRSSHRDSSHRRHRSRSEEDTDRKRSRRDRDKDYDRDRSRDRDRDRKRSHRHRSRSTGRDDLAKRIETSRRSRHSRDDGREKEDAVVEDNDVGFKIKGSRSAAMKAPPSGPKRDQRRESIAEKDAPVNEATVDHYALEREARHKERVLKEQQRRESAVSKTSGKRGRDDFDPPNGPRDEGRKRRDEGRRRGGVFYEDELDDGRGERERESGRW